MATDKIQLPEGFHDLGEDLAQKGQGHIEKVEEEADTHIHYPSLWFHNKAELKDLPKEGTAIIHYKKVMEREEKITINGKEENRYTTELEIYGIKAGEATESTEAEASEHDDEDAIEMGLEAASKSKETDNE
jgi:hypothetical protein